MNGQREASSGAAAVRRLGEEIPRPDPKRVAPWYYTPAAWPWTWNETRDQYEAKRQVKSKVL